LGVAGQQKTPVLNGYEMAEDYIDYGKLIDEAMRQIVRKSLILVEEKGLTGDHHFFITFQTKFPGVMISDRLLEKYPEEMTIIIQHQFWELEIEEKSFSVVLSFDNVHESLNIPFDALTAFADPSVKFGLQFRKIPLKKESRQTKKTTKKKSGETDESGGNIVVLDSFRKK
jgi:uncharacterized protein